MRKILVGVLLLSACVSDPGPDPSNDPVVVMTIPSRLFVAGEARIDIMEGTPVIGATITVRAEAPTPAVACVRLLDENSAEISSQCSERTVVSDSRPIRIPMYEITMGPQHKLALSVQANGAVVDGALVAMRVLPDPL